MSTEAPRQVTDGRRARRERGRLAAIDAMIDLIFEGQSPPAADEVARRAGISMATLFRYFEKLDDLRRETTTRYFERYADFFDLPEIGEGTLDARITRFVDTRASMHETTASMARFARSRASEAAAVGDVLHRLRATQADQIRHHFDRELASLTKSDRDDLVAILSITTSFEAWDQMCVDHGRSPAQIRRAWNAALTRLLRP